MTNIPTVAVTGTRGRHEVSLLESIKYNEKIKMDEIKRKSEKWMEEKKIWGALCQ